MLLANERASERTGADSKSPLFALMRISRASLFLGISLSLSLSSAASSPRKVESTEATTCFRSADSLSPLPPARTLAPLTVSSAAAAAAPSLQASPLRLAGQNRNLFARSCCGSEMKLSELPAPHLNLTQHNQSSAAAAAAR